MLHSIDSARRPRAAPIRTAFVYLPARRRRARLATTGDARAALSATPALGRDGLATSRDPAGTPAWSRALLDGRRRIVAAHRHRAAKASCWTSSGDAAIATLTYPLGCASLPPTASEAHDRHVSINVNSICRKGLTVPNAADAMASSGRSVAAGKIVTEAFGRTAAGSRFIGARLLRCGFMRVPRSAYGGMSPRIVLGFHPAVRFLLVGWRDDGARAWLALRSIDAIGGANGYRGASELPPFRRANTLTNCRERARVIRAAQPAQGSSGGRPQSSRAISAIFAAAGSRRLRRRLALPVSGGGFHDHSAAAAAAPR